MTEVPGVKVEIPLEQYNQLIKDQKAIRALEDGGVKSWTWYHESLKKAGLLAVNAQKG